MAATILVVEDEPAIQELISYNLELAGHQALRAENAEQALDMVRDALPDLVVLDWMLPGMSGIEFARRLRSDKRTQSVPLIMLTARADERDKLQGHGLRALVGAQPPRSEEHTSELQSLRHLVCRLLLEKKK